MSVLQFRAKHFKKLLHDVESFVQNSDAFPNFQVAVNAVVEGLKLLLLPKEFWSVENVRVQIDRIALDKQLPNFLADFCAVERDFSVPVWLKQGSYFKCRCVECVV